MEKYEVIKFKYDEFEMDVRAAKRMIQFG